MEIKDYYKKHAIWETFFFRFLERDVKARIPHAEIYKVYARWATEKGLIVLSTRALTQFLRRQETIYGGRGTNNIKVWYGLRLRKAPILRTLKADEHRDLLTAAYR